MKLCFSYTIAMGGVIDRLIDISPPSLYSLMNRVEDGVVPMMECLESHIVTQGLAQMQACADTISTVS